MQPYTDDLMRWDDATGRYYLQETALIRQGVDLRARLGRSPSPEYVVNGLLNRATALVYGYIHGHNMNTLEQDRLIAETPSMRDIIYNALLSQALYIIYNGDLSISVKPEERENYMDITARMELARIMPEHGRNILYSGGDLMDLLDILNGHAEEVFSGTYFAKLPQSDKTDEAGILFDYEHVDPTSWSFRRMFGNMVNDAATTAIKSCDPVDWKVGGYMRLQDGRTYTIEALQRDYKTRQAFRYLDKVAGTDTVMRLTQVEDPFR